MFGFANKNEKVVLLGRQHVFWEGNAVGKYQIFFLTSLASFSFILAKDYWTVCKEVVVDGSIRINRPLLGIFKEVVFTHRYTTRCEVR